MSKKPIHEIRFGLIKATIWENANSGSAPRYSVGVCRLYKNGEAWVESMRFGRDDLPLFAKVADHAHTWIFHHARGDAAALRPAE